MKNSLILLVLVAGCASKPPVLTVEDRAGLAAHIVFNIVTANKTKPDDQKPDLKPGDPCPECGGRGKQGDGTTEYDCEECEGTGKVLPKKVSYNSTNTDFDATAVLRTWPPRQIPDCVTPTAKTGQTDLNKQASPIRQVIRRSNTKWSVNGQMSYSQAELAYHLLQVHKVDPTGYTFTDMQAIHDNLHNGYTAFGDK